LGDGNRPNDPIIIFNLDNINIKNIIICFINITIFIIIQNTIICIIHIIILIIINIINKIINKFEKILLIIIIINKLKKILLLLLKKNHQFF